LSQLSCNYKGDRFLKQLSHILALGSNQTNDMFIDHCFNFLIRSTIIFYHNFKHNYLVTLFNFCLLQRKHRDVLFERVETLMTIKCNE
jgi:hypothetical protein